MYYNGMLELKQLNITTKISDRQSIQVYYIHWSNPLRHKCDIWDDIS